MDEYNMKEFEDMIRYSMNVTADLNEEISRIHRTLIDLQYMQLQLISRLKSYSETEINKLQAEVDDLKSRVI